MKSLKTLAAGGFLFVLTASFVLTGDTSSIEGKVYKVSISEAKKGKSGPNSDDDVSFKSGKFKCKFFGKNAGADAIAIELTTDSTYSDDSGEDMLYVEFEGEMTNKLEENVKVTGTIDGYGIEGNVELSKKGKVKHHWDYVGSLKEKKKH
ncbi:MAG TPA: hypothetical protein VFU15_03815 [Bacteroidia bacterium]|nr:hypothetical protein [Bacteroidia bacterium]